MDPESLLSVYHNLGGYLRISSGKMIKWTVKTQVQKKKLSQPRRLKRRLGLTAVQKAWKAVLIEAGGSKKRKEIMS